MRFLFIHKFFPGQFRELIRALSRTRKHEIVAIAQEKGPESETLADHGCELLLYAPPQSRDRQEFQSFGRIAEDFKNGELVAKVLQQLRDQGFVPDVIFGHGGWGETSFVKDVFHNVPFIAYCEHFLRADGADVDFLLSGQVALAQRCLIRSLNCAQIGSLVDSDCGVSPTNWQRSGYPDILQGKIHQLHEGIDVEFFKPNRHSTFKLPNGRVLSRDDEVVTYVSRNLEPYRGFPQFMEAVAMLQQKRPKAQVVVVGGDKVSYSPSLPKGMTYREKCCDDFRIDRSRVHFFKWLSATDYRRLLQVSSVHVYLTVPFVLSWSVLEAMACECVVVGSDTAPVQEVLVHQRNGLLCDFFSPMEIASEISNVLDHPTRMGHLGQQAREDMIHNYDSKLGVAKYLRLIENLTGQRAEV
jgi:glycosyltransferase involved in cell wall biosynthesis